MRSFDPQGSVRKVDVRLSGWTFDFFFDMLGGTNSFFLFLGEEGYLFTKDPRKVLRPTPSARDIDFSGWLGQLFVITVPAPAPAAHTEITLLCSSLLFFK